MTTVTSRDPCRIEDERVLERTGLVGPRADPAHAPVVQQADGDRAGVDAALTRTTGT